MEPWGGVHWGMSKYNANDKELNRLNREILRFNYMARRGLVCVRCKGEVVRCKGDTCRDCLDWLAFAEKRGYGT